MENIQGETLPAGRELNVGELTALMHACGSDASPVEVRDAALIALIYSGRLRRDEAAKLNYEDFDPTANRLMVRRKRNKQRSVYLAEGAIAALADWLQVRGPLPGPLFYPINKIRTPT